MEKEASDDAIHEGNRNKNGKCGCCACNHGKSHFTCTVQRGLKRWLPLFQLFHDRFNNDDGVVYEQSDGNGECKQRQDVDRKPQKIKAKKSGHKGCRDRQGHDDRRSEIQEENKGHGNDKPDGNHDVMGDVLD